MFDFEITKEKGAITVAFGNGWVALAALLILWGMFG